MNGHNIRIDQSDFIVEDKMIIKVRIRKKCDVLTNKEYLSSINPNDIIIVFPRHAPRKIQQQQVTVVTKREIRTQTGLIFSKRTGEGIKGCCYKMDLLFDQRKVDPAILSGVRSL